MFQEFFILCSLVSSPSFPTLSFKPVITLLALIICPSIHSSGCCLFILLCLLTFPPYSTSLSPPGVTSPTAHVSEGTQEEDTSPLQENKNRDTNEEADSRYTNQNNADGGAIHYERKCFAFFYLVYSLILNLSFLVLFKAQLTNWKKQRRRIPLFQNPT